MSTYVESIGIKFKPESCIYCGAWFAMSQETYDQKQRTGQGFHCPSCGKSMVYGSGKSDVQRAREEHEKAQLALQAKLNEANHARLVAEKALAVTKIKLTKIKNRVAHGVCPCCNETFADLSHHMIQNHKDFRLQGSERKRIAS